MHSAGLITFLFQETSIQAEVQLDISAQDNNRLMIYLFQDISQQDNITRNVQRRRI